VEFVGRGGGILAEEEIVEGIERLWKKLMVRI